MSVYNCVLCGAWAAYLAWAITAAAGMQGIESDLLFVTVLGGTVGLVTSAALGTIDSVFNTSPSQRLPRILTVMLFGFLGGIAGGILCDLVTKLSPYLRFLGWTILGVAIGATINAYDVLQAKMSGRPIGLAGRKFRYGLVGGALGGSAGGLLFTLLDLIGLRDSIPRFALAVSFVVLGSLIGLLVGLAQIILKEAWIRVESGFRPGREFVLAKEETTLGRAESCDFGLSGDPSIDRVHARIHQQEGSFLLADAGSEGGTFLNNRRVTQPTKLYTGDVIRAGGSVLLFGEREKSSG
jgi:MFS family permease